MARLTVRCSQLSSHSVCVRKSFASIIKDEITKKGHVLRTVDNSIAAAQGSALHAMMAELFKQKMSYGEMNLTDAYAAREAAFLEEVNKGVIWDQTTRHIDTAKAQLLAMGKALLPVAELTNPAAVEDELEHDVDPLGTGECVIRLIGHRDVKDVRNEIHDHKTGLELPSCHEQLGGYSILSELNGERISALRVNFVPRLPMSKLHETKARSVRLDMEECERAAWETLRSIQIQYLNYLETGDEYSFAPNPRADVCSQKYCSSYDTTWCCRGHLK